MGGQPHSLGSSDKGGGLSDPPFIGCFHFILSFSHIMEYSVIIQFSSNSRVRMPVSDLQISVLMLTLIHVNVINTSKGVEDAVIVSDNTIS